MKLRRRQQYFDAAEERSEDSMLLHRQARYALAMYVAGLSAEAMLRAYHPDGSTFDDKHDVELLLAGAAFPELGHTAHKALQSAVFVVKLYWRNAFRFAAESDLRAYFKSLRLDDRAGGVQKDSDFLKVRSKQLSDNCRFIVELGVSRWKP